MEIKSCIAEPRVVTSLLLISLEFIVAILISLLICVWPQKKWYLVAGTQTNAGTMLLEEDYAKNMVQ